MARSQSARRRVMYAALLLLGFAAMPGIAQEVALPRERGSLQVGAFITDRATTTRLDHSSGLGTDISLESDLGFNRSLSVFRLSGDFWIGERHRVDVSMFDLSRSASRAIDKTIEFGDQTFDIDTMVVSKNDLAILKSDYTYAVVNRERGYFGLTAGLYIASAKLSLSEATLGRAESEGLTAPLPVLGIRGSYDMTDRLSFIGYTEWFSIDTGDASGNLRDLYASVDYRLSERWALGLAYNEVTMTINADESSGFRGQLDWGYDGWLVYAKLRFGVTNR